MFDIDEVALFPLGRIVITQGVMSGVPADEVASAVVRHSQGDWGDVCDEDRQSNEMALLRQTRLLSAYQTTERKIWIITEADRSYTTILLPLEY